MFHSQHLPTGSVSGLKNAMDTNNKTLTWKLYLIGYQTCPVNSSEIRVFPPKKRSKRSPACLPRWCAANELESLSPSPPLALATHLWFTWCARTAQSVATAMHNAFGLCQNHFTQTTKNLATQCSLHPTHLWNCTNTILSPRTRFKHCQATFNAITHTLQTWERV